MEGLVLIGFFVTGLAMLALAALRFGVDSRPGSSDPRQRADGLYVA
jgi:hypothetical protein